MKKIKGFAFGLAIGLIIGLVGCSTVNVMAEQKYPLKIWYQNKNGQMETCCIVDDDTGVNYIVVAPNISSNNGNKYDGVAITPRLNQDGSLFISKDN